MTRAAVNSWSHFIRALGQAAIDNEPLRFDADDARFTAVVESLSAKEYSGVWQAVQPEPGPTLVPVSGGLDSLVAWQRAVDEGRETEAFYVALNTPYRDIELAVLRGLRVPARLIDYSWWPKRWQPYATDWAHILPLRNLLIICAIAEQATSPGEIWLGATEGEIPARGGDKSRRFFDGVETILRTYPVQHRLVFPLAHETKTDLVAWWLDRGHSPARLLATVTCQAGTATPCGGCHACFNRWVALTNNGLSETMLTDPRTVPANAGKVERFRAALDAGDFSVWSQRRMEQTLAAWDR